MYIVWRFFANEYGKWRWQKLGPDRAIISQSLRAFDSYDSCIDAARRSGYVFQLAQQRTTRRDVARTTRVTIVGQPPDRGGLRARPRASASRDGCYSSR
jgi:hypothetical protein